MCLHLCSLISRAFYLNDHYYCCHASLEKVVLFIRTSLQCFFQLAVKLLIPVNLIEVLPKQLAIVIFDDSIQFSRSIFIFLF